MRRSVSQGEKLRLGGRGEAEVKWMVRRQVRMRPKKVWCIVQDRDTSREQACPQTNLEFQLPSILVTRSE
jgi:hypothetical protein